MDIATNIPDWMWLFVEQHEKERARLLPEHDKQIVDIYARLKREHQWMHAFFSQWGANEAEIEDLEQITLYKYLNVIESQLWAMLLDTPVSASGQRMSYIHEVELDENGNPIHFSFAGTQVIENFDAYIQEYLERFAGIEHPKALFQTIARNVRIDWYRDRKRMRTDQLPSEEGPSEDDAPDVKRLRYQTLEALSRGTTLTVHGDKTVERRFAPEPRNIETHLVAKARAAELDRRSKEFRERYIRALAEMPASLRKAWILCKDQTLKREEIIQLIGLRAARKVPEARPISQAAAGAILALALGTVGSYVTRASVMLAEKLADLNPLPASRKRTVSSCNSYPTVAPNPELFWSRLIAAPPDLTIAGLLGTPGSMGGSWRSMRSIRTGLANLMSRLLPRPF